MQSSVHGLYTSANFLSEDWLFLDLPWSCKLETFQKLNEKNKSVIASHDFSICNLRLNLNYKRSFPSSYYIEIRFILPWSQRLSFILSFLFGNLRREALIEAPSPREKKASGQDR